MKHMKDGQRDNEEIKALLDTEVTTPQKQPNK